MSVIAVKKSELETVKYLMPRYKNETQLEHKNRCKKIIQYLHDEDFCRDVSELYGFEDDYKFVFNRPKSADKNKNESNYFNDSLMLIKANEVYRENHKHGFINCLKKFFLVAGSTVLVSTVFYGTAVGLTKLYAITAEVDAKQVVYHQNENIEPGYYNENPIKICISDKFNGIFRNGIEKGIRTFDDAALGLKFEIRVGDLEKLKGEYDVSFVPSYEYKGNSNGLDVLGYTYLSSNDAKEIKGPIYLMPNKMHLFGVKATTMHELGHKIGLEHTDDPNSLMFPVCSNFGLSQSDIDNINTIYPAKSEEKVVSESTTEISQNVTINQPIDKILKTAKLPEEYER